MNGILKKNSFGEARFYPSHRQVVTNQQQPDKIT